MASISEPFLQGQLQERKNRLETAIHGAANPAPLVALLQEVDTALDRMKRGTYGLCESCHDTIEAQRLLADPLVRYCIDHLSPAEQRALQADLDLASRIQAGLLPAKDLRLSGWRTHYHYEPLGAVSGDYCDLIQTEDGTGELLFLLGDVSGKGVAASMLMSQLHAMFRSLSSIEMPLDQMVARANRLFCESNMAGQFATLICGRAGHGGEVQLASAGHPDALWLRNGEVERIEATAMPLGLFCGGSFPTRKLILAPGESLVFYTDGVSEMHNPDGADFGTAQLTHFLRSQHSKAPEGITSACLDELKRYAAGTPKLDDLTLLVLRRES